VAWGQPACAVPVGMERCSNCPTCCDRSSNGRVRTHENPGRYPPGVAQYWMAWIRSGPGRTNTPGFPLVWGCGGVGVVGVVGSSGGVLLSHDLAVAVPSALEGLASGFGMGPGVSPPLWPPEHRTTPTNKQVLVGWGVQCVDASRALFLDTQLVCRFYRPRVTSGGVSGKSSAY
jgi:hypothetical protein